MLWLWKTNILTNRICLGVSRRSKDDPKASVDHSQMSYYEILGCLTWIAFLNSKFKVFILLTPPPFLDNGCQSECRIVIVMLESTP